jgi:uncharacterized membrane protein HdeD (DUF308 family)
LKKPEPLFLIITGALTALFLPFALAFPHTLFAKMGAMLGLILVAAGIAAAVLALKKKKAQRNQ